MPVIFFDIGDTLATPRLAADGRLLGFTVLPGVQSALQRLSERSLRMGIISNRGNIPPDEVTAALDAAGLLGFFDPTLIIFERKDSPAPFTRAASKASVAPDACFFVGENNEERTHALNAGFKKAIPDPSLVLDVLDGAALLFAALSHPESQPDQWLKAFSDAAVVPVRVANNGRRIDVITTTSVITSLDKAGFEVQIIGKEDDPQIADLYLIRDDRRLPEGFVSLEAFSTDFVAQTGRRDLVVGSTNEGLLVALPAGVSIEEFHFPEALHGHNERLIPDMSLLQPLTSGNGTAEELSAHAAFAPVFGPDELEVLRRIDATSLQQLHERYIGVAPLTSSSGPIVSRHINHPDNARATHALVDDFAKIGGADIVVTRHPFNYGVLRLENIEAELRGGEDPGSLVLISAHLDSTANNSPPFNPASDPAPGSDDDASGVAAVLAAAGAIAALRLLKKTLRTIRFVLFNAEEQGRVGSIEYARAEAARQADIAAVFQMDMIGFRGEETDDGKRNFEAHAGFAAARGVEERSVALVQLVRDAVSQVSPNLNAPQVYPSTPGGHDPASGRSDHTPFQQRGYAACVLCEDYFAGPKSDSPTAQPNLNYHKKTDKEIDYEYAADIARAVTAAALVVART